MQYVWFIWSLVILALWAIIYVLRPAHRKVMLNMSLITMPFGATEPLFVPEYWFPPSLFDLAERTGFDIESFLFSFAIGGIGTVGYLILFNKRMMDVPDQERSSSRHRLHTMILYSPILVFFILSAFTSLNHIYCGILAMFIGALSTLYCRPDLKGKIWVGGALFLALYFIYFKSILLFYPDYVTLYWNLDELLDVFIAGIPIEELLFAFSFGMLWSSLFEHLHWRTLVPVKPSIAQQ